jgi:hypothetical protein
MKIKFLTMCTAPRSSTEFWQCVFIPTVSAYCSYYDGNEQHLAINFEWLFWSITILTYTDDDKRAVYHH